MLIRGGKTKIHLVYGQSFELHAVNIVSHCLNENANKIIKFPVLFEPCGRHAQCKTEELPYTRNSKNITFLHKNMIIMKITWYNGRLPENGSLKVIGLF